MVVYLISRFNWAFPYVSLLRLATLPSGLILLSQRNRVFTVSDYLHFREGEENLMCQTSSRLPTTALPIRVRGKRALRTGYLMTGHSVKTRQWQRPGCSGGRGSLGHPLQSLPGVLGNFRPDSLRPVRLRVNTSGRRQHPRPSPPWL